MQVPKRFITSEDTMVKQETCKAQWAEHKNSRFTDLRRLIKAYENGVEDVPNLGSLYDYGLAFDYVNRENKAGYWRYQLSCGGPGDEIRFYANGPKAPMYDATYWFLDWFDGHGRKLYGQDRKTAEWLWDWFRECESTITAYVDAMED